MHGLRVMSLQVLETMEGVSGGCPACFYRQDEALAL
jgi:hypothetical protein